MDNVKKHLTGIVATLVVCLGFSLPGISQTITNVTPELKKNAIYIHYQLNGMRSNQRINTMLYVSTDGGKTFKGPMIEVSGDIGLIKTNGQKMVAWDIKKEMEISNITAVFEIRAALNEKRSADYYKYKKSKGFWLSSALVTGAAGTFLYLQSGTTYTQYQTATTDATTLQQKVMLYDTIYPICFAVAGFSAIEFIVKATKQGKAKKQSLGFNPQPLPGGAGLSLTYNF